MDSPSDSLSLERMAPLLRCLHCPDESLQYLDLSPVKPGDFGLFLCT